jgi:hypothetical protein
MISEEALQLLERELANFREESYTDLTLRIPAGPVHIERSAADGAEYQLEFQFVWDDGAGGNIRVIGSIDDGGWRAFVPIARSFIKSADGSFVGE